MILTFILSLESLILFWMPLIQIFPAFRLDSNSFITTSLPTHQINTWQLNPRPHINLQIVLFLLIMILLLIEGIRQLIMMLMLTNYWTFRVVSMKALILICYMICLILRLFYSLCSLNIWTMSFRRRCLTLVFIWHHTV